MRILLCTLVLVTSGLTTAQTPIPRVGDSCPTGTYRSGDYCKPFKSSSADGQNIIEKSGKQCPTGYYSSGDYCKQYPSRTDKEAIPREGKDCPGGWYKSGHYCMQQ
jgi:hypothetical protein